MPELARFQREFVDAIDLPAPVGSAMQVYRNTVMLGAIEALCANFPVCGRVLGAETFEALALEYARRSPPEVLVLAFYGNGFGEWLGAQPISRELPYLADLARCEEMHTAALHAADGPALSQEAIGQLGAESLMAFKPKLHPAARFGWFSSPAMAIWLAHQDEAEFDELVPEWRAGGALFTRPHARVYGAEIDALGHRLLAGFRLGENLGTAARAASSLFPEADIGAAFGQLVAGGAFAAPLS